MDSGASDSVGSPESLEALVTELRKKFPETRVKIDKAAAQNTRFRLADGSLTAAYSQSLIETLHGWFSCYCIESSAGGKPASLLMSIKSLRSLKAMIDFDTDQIFYEARNVGGEAFKIERVLGRTSGGHLLFNIADAETGRKDFEKADP